MKVILSEGKFYEVSKQQRLSQQEGRLRYWAQEFLKAIFPVKHEFLFIRKKNTIYCLSKVTGKWAKAKCSTKDTFYLEVGQAIALLRVLYNNDDRIFEDLFE
jgi:hypothetical protein